MSAPGFAVLAATRRVDSAKPAARRFWLLHGWLPAIAFAAMLSLFSVTSLDTTIAATLFFDTGPGTWLGAKTWWANDLLHTGGQEMMRGLTVAAIVLWVAGRLRPSLRDRGALAGYFALCVTLTVGLVGLLKEVTNVDCPWDLRQFGGTRPYVHVIGERPDDVPPGRCFPGAHSSSGFALLCLYFAFRDRSARLARAALLGGLALGALFSIAQQARGAHFVSHDLASAFIAWFVALGSYPFGWRPPWLE